MTLLLLLTNGVAFDLYVTCPRSSEYVTYMKHVV